MTPSSEKEVQSKKTPETYESEFTIQKLINEKVRSERKPKEINSWTPSRLGSCLTGVYLERLGVEPDRDFDDRTLRVFSVGKHFEDWIVSLIKDSGHKIETQVRLEWKEMDLSGYADLMVDDEIPYEIKSKHSAGFKYLPNLQHKMQLWVALKCLDRSEGRLIYFSKDDLRVEEFQVFLNDEDLATEVEEELAVLNEAWEKKLAPNPPPQDSWKSKFCRWHGKCVSQEHYLN